MTEKLGKDILPITCEVTGKLLARMDTQGIYLWCKLCHEEHYIVLPVTATSVANWQTAQEHLLLIQK